MSNLHLNEPKRCTDGTYYHPNNPYDLYRIQGGHRPFIVFDWDKAARLIRAMQPNDAWVTHYYELKKGEPCKSSRIIYTNRQVYRRKTISHNIYSDVSAIVLGSSEESVITVRFDGEEGIGKECSIPFEKLPQGMKVRYYLWWPPSALDILRLYRQDIDINKIIMEDLVDELH